MATRKFPRFDMPQIQSEDHAPDSIKCILDENLSVTQTALAFQRWRNLHLKNLFSHELKKVLEEAQKDEACLTFMEQEISSKEQQLARALADAAQLRAQLSGLNLANENNQDSNEVSLYNELQMLQELIVKEARSHQEKTGNKEKHIDDVEHLGDNASHFSSSLWRICNGLANCLIDARNQILVLAADSKSTTLPKTGALLKSCSKSMGILGYPNLGNKTCNKASPEKAKVRFQDDCEEQKLKEETNGHRKMQTDFIESTDNAQSSTLMGTGGKRRDRHENAVNTPGRRRTDRYSLIFSKRNKRGPHYASLIQSRMAQSKWWHNLRDQ